MRLPCWSGGESWACRVPTASRLQVASKPSEPMRGAFGSSMPLSRHEGCGMQARVRAPILKRDGGSAGTLAQRNGDRRILRGDDGLLAIETRLDRGVHACRQEGADLGCRRRLAATVSAALANRRVADVVGGFGRLGKFASIARPRTRGRAARSRRAPQARFARRPVKARARQVRSSSPRRRA